MKTYVVGGAVRDRLLGRPVQDRDHVVVGATPQQLVARGFTPVGKDFPVFLHPHTHEEYALARTERSTGPGYKGFTFHTAPDVTLEDDLIRRDLTINAIAEDEDGTLIDPFGGQRDLAAKLFRHVSSAFAEDPVRILRVARFAARFADFAVAPETLALMRQMVAAGEVDHLVPERVWQELARGLMEAKPSRMFAVLRDCGALAHILPELDALWGVPQPEIHHPEIDTGAHVMLVVDLAAAAGHPLPVRFAALLHDLGKGVTPKEGWPSHHGHEALGVPLVQAICQRLRVPNDCRDLALMTAREHGNIGRGLQLRAATLVNVFERCDAIRRPERFFDMLKAAECDFRGRSGEQRTFANEPYPQAAHWQAALAAARSIDAGAIAHANRENPPRIPLAIHEARVAAVRAIAGVSEEGAPSA
ncbi:MAG: cca [Burkholderiaceae bacterium]|nr:cca [Burkholderiaceae bacterium]